MDKNERSKATKEEQLGMKLGTASGRLRKGIMFAMAKKLDLDTCYHCDAKIIEIDEFSIEHKDPWLHSANPIEKFFDIDNIAFSHLKCNVGAARRPHQKYFTPEEMLEAHRRQDRESKRRKYSKEKRRHKFKTTGH